jgi:hypothetical protein
VELPERVTVYLCWASISSSVRLTGFKRVENPLVIDGWVELGCYEIAALVKRGFTNGKLSLNARLSSIE